MTIPKSPMKIYIKSAGRKDTQDYVWACLSGEENPSDLTLISKAEGSVPNRGIVHAFSPPGNGRTALFLGNVRSDRTDFGGTPILNRMAIVYSENDDERQDFIRTLVAEWMSGTSELIPLLRDGIVKSGNARGFDWSGDFLHKLEEIMGNIEDHAVPADGVTDDRKNASPQPMKTGNRNMKIAIQVPSGINEYQWYFGECPDYARTVEKICGNSSIAQKCFRAALHKQQNRWCLFLRDIIASDDGRGRLAQATIAIDIPDDSPQAEEKARRLLVAWLTPVSPLLEVFKKNVDVSSESVVADPDALYNSVEKLAAGEELPAEPLPTVRVLYRISEDLSNLDQLRAQAAEFVRTHKFGNQEGVHFLFTHCPYSTIPGDIDMLPDIPAKFIVLGWRDEEVLVSATTESGKPDDNNWLIVGTIAVAVAIVLFIIYFAFGGCKNIADATPEKSKLQSVASAAQQYRDEIPAPIKSKKRTSNQE